ncbi:MAG TPA: nucleoside hydrolase, partial [Gammaproteobacteria bacterium]|nr:nucleoside hydrolase [Gammaproteobacteria bacterium]
AEFNIYVDPHAADVVFRSGVPLTMMGLDVTHQVLVTPERIETIRSCGGQTARVVADLLSFYCRYDRSRYGTDGGPLHDPCVIAHLVDPALFACRHVNVQIEIASPLTLGQTVADWWQATEAQANCHVAYAVDDEAFFSQLTQKLSTLP